MAREGRAPSTAASWGAAAKDGSEPESTRRNQNFEPHVHLSPAQHHGPGSTDMMAAWTTEKIIEAPTDEGQHRQARPGACAHDSVLGTSPQVRHARPARAAL